MTVAVIGMGLIGGSIAKAIKAKTGHKVLGTNRSPGPLQKAKACGAIDEIAEDDFSGADLILPALYPSDTITFLQRHMHTFRPGVVVVDLCGVKGAVCRAARELFRDKPITFIGGHPMAGLEVSGFDHSIATLYDGASMILTPFPDTPPGTLKMVEDFFLSLGFGSITHTTPEHHDEVIAYTSQLAHVVSSAYVRSPFAQENMGFSAGSFKDLTRVAKLNETMWTELFLLNKDNLLREIDTILHNLTHLRDSLRDGDADTLRELLRQGRESKELLNRREEERRQAKSK